MADDEPTGTTDRWAWGILAAVAVVFLALGLVQAGRDAPTVDEGVDVSSGVASLVRHDLRMNPEHPALPKAIAALPALLAHPIVPDTKAWAQGNWFDWSDDFIAANARAGRLDDILLYARAVVLLEAVACAALLYVLAKRFFGPTGGLLVAVAWLVTPYVVGLGHFAMIDIPFVLVTLGFCVLLARWGDAPTLGRAAALGAMIGVGLASRHTMLVLAAFAAVVVVHRLRRTPREAATQVAVLALVSVAVLWAVYLVLSPGGSSSSVQASFEGLISQQGSASLPVRIIGNLPLPLAWRAGFAYLDLTSTARPSSLLGQSWSGGRWWYFPMSALLKVPLLTCAVVVAGWVVAVRRPGGRRALLTYVALPGLLLWLFLVAQPLNLGLRLAMPTVALAFVGIGALARQRAGVSAVLGLSLLALVVSAPHSLAWTQRPFTPSYRWVSDSNLDAGQALYEVRRWAEVHDRPYVAIDTTRGMTVGGGSRSLADVDPADVRGWVAVGVTPLMQTRVRELAWLRKYCPVGAIGGGSVLVYRFTEAPDPSPGPERPVGPCFGARRSSDRTG
ncbi:MAG: glycosyltransferase family 39 protein [Acidimicrobiales bacterium]